VLGEGVSLADVLQGRIAVEVIGLVVFWDAGDGFEEVVEVVW
jgi:hypothetical protein